MATADHSLPLEKTGALAGRRMSFRLIGSIAVGVALLSALATFLVLSGLTPLPPTHNVVVSLLGINALAAFVLIAIIGREVARIVRARRVGRAGAQLHVRIVGLFAIIAAVPTILVAIVATITLDRGLDRFFSVRTKAIIENSLMVSEAYLREHAQMIRARHSRHGAGRGARQAAIRFRPRTLSAVPRRPNHHPRAAAGGDPERRSGSDRTHECARHPGFRDPEQGCSEDPERHRAAGRADPGIQLCRERHQAARLRQSLSLCRPADRSAHRRAIARDSRERQRLRRSWNRDGSASPSPSA